MEKKWKKGKEVNGSDRTRERDGELAPLRQISLILSLERGSQDKREY